uniref:TPR_REGION domain-containing protein n=1 Tax=Rhabditophanes sp. KR3021 TaxID=114890 RepID=A0AC35U0L9_9BILA
MVLKSWDKVNEAIQNASLINNESIGLYESVLADLFETVDRIEESNHDLTVLIAQLLLSISLDNPIVINYGNKFMNKAIEMNDSVYNLSLRCQYLIKMNKEKEALTLSTDILKVYTGESPDVLLVLVLCYLVNGKKVEAKTQLEFLKHSHPKITRHIGYYHLEAIVEKNNNKPHEIIVSCTKNGIDIHLANLQNMAYGNSYLVAINCDILISMCQTLFEIAPLAPSKVVDPTLKEVSRILAIIHSNFPGIDRAIYLLAKAKFLEFEIEEAESLLKKCIDKPQQIAEVYLLMAQIQIQRRKIEEAEKYLDSGLSLNFKVKEHPLYHLTKALLLKQEKKIDESILLLKQALTLPTFKENKNQSDSLHVSDNDKISIYLELIDSLQMINNIKEADQYMIQATEFCKGKPEEQQLFLMSAQLRIYRGDVDGGVQILNNIAPQQPNYQMAQLKLAEIYMDEKKDPSKFAKCYQNILESNPTVETYMLLGDAYMSVQEPLKAIEVYETAMKKNPRDAYMSVQEPLKAIEVYETAMKKNPPLSMSQLVTGA